MQLLMQFFLLGLYTARLELFKFFFFLVFGAFLWCLYLVYETSGSSSRKRYKKRALIYTAVTGVLLLGMSITWLLSKTNMGWWFE
ncbi:MAG TPA: hypothetical protein PKE63_14525 [Lacibacter sp.]|nr:hypothetical protein [Lacibacter sp.]HMO88723.1 hypothetical protein [Lacibacter sp.]HMP88491.1 hypothetical protein [Lacibacter sp.]